MAGSQGKRYVIIHGHFYQPPRENPWTGRIDRQDGASPYHDWNEKICSECYLPNARSRRLDGYGRVTSLVNNYEHISFNFGPTLMGWIEEKHPRLHQQILDADRASAERLGGHGNAIAQVYNHLIMPLATPRDQETQIRWGIADFERRFGRTPEGIWLAETAINETTLEILVDFGFRFIILSPFQAESIRPLGKGSAWKNVSDGSIPPGTVYRSYGERKKGRKNTKRFIDIFFYDAPISTDISFNHLLSSGDRLADAFLASFGRCGGDLVPVATDGEIYGHHEPFGDMALAYLIETAAGQRGLTLTNFGHYLDSHPPAWEVRIKRGSNGEGTAWSCSHGVGRWKEDCGCNTGSPLGWNQKWRTPLRDSLDNLRTGLDSLFGKEGAGLLKDPWRARDRYVEILGGRSGRDLEESAMEIESFMKEEGVEGLSGAERTRALSLLESQLNSLLMFTSCGWFFNDISGIETVQLLKYAARAIELTDGNEAGILESVLLAGLEKAKSNIREYGTGKDIYLASKKYSSFRPSLLAGQHLLALNYSCPDASPELLGYGFEEIDSLSINIGEHAVSMGRLAMTDPLLLQRTEFQYLIIPGGSVQSICILKEYSGEKQYEDSKRFFSDFKQGAVRKEILQSATEHFGGHVVSLRDLFPEERETILASIASRQVSGELDLFGDLYVQNREMLRLFSETALAPPASLLVPAKTVLSARLREALSKWERSFATSGLEGIREVISEAEYYGVKIDRSEVTGIFTSFFLESLKKLYAVLNAELTDQLYDFAEYSYGIHIEIPQHDIQNELFLIIEKHSGGASAAGGGETSGGAVEPGKDRKSFESLLRLARRFNFDTSRWQ